MECTFPAGETAAAKRQREQPGGRAKLAATDIAIDIQQYTHAGPDGTISIAIAGALARANA